MNANISIDQKLKGMFTTINGAEIKVCSQQVYARQPMWHRMGTVFPAGLQPIEALRLLDPNGDMETWLEPLVTRQILADGKIRLIQQPYAMISRNPAMDSEDGHPIVFGKPVYTGSMTPEQWAAMNTNPLRPTRSVNYELVTPSVVFQMVQDDLRDEYGNVVIAESAGFLGKFGVKGFFISVKLPEWDTETAKALGTAVQEYFHIYVDPKAMIHIYNTSIVAVCQNTVLFGIKNASRLLRVDQTEGATDRLRQSVSSMFGNAMVTRELAQESALYLLDKPMNADEVAYVAEQMYPEPAKVDKTFVAKSSIEAREDDYRFRLDTVMAHRLSMVEFFRNPELQPLAGITPQAVDTAWGGLQAATFKTTYTPFKNGGRQFAETFAGGVKKQALTAYNTIMKMKNPDFEAVAIETQEDEGEAVPA